MPGDDARIIRKAREGFGWADVERLDYKHEGSAPFKDISRQVLFSDPGLAAQLRYFEIAPGGFSTRSGTSICMP